MPDYALELGGLRPVCGIDEAGRGPWAGPVVAAAVILDPECIPDGLDDSKLLSRPRREELHLLLRGCAAIGVGQASVEEIEQLNILRASLLAMRRAVAALPFVPAAALVDGNQLPELPCPCQPVPRGDGLSLSIAAASIVAKVTRDALMVTLSQQFPAYGWETNAGYGTQTHAEALAAHGITPHHRRTFRPIHNMLCEADPISS